MSVDAPSSPSVPGRPPGPRRDLSSRELLSLLESTVESSADGLLVVDAAGRIVLYNRRFVELWGLPDEVIGSHVDERAITWVVDKLQDPQAFLARVRDLYGRPDAESFDVLRFKDGRVFERYSRPQRVDGRSVGRVWSFRDVTQRSKADAELLRLMLELEDERRQLDQALAEARRSQRVAEEALRVRDDFLSIVSHDLKGPLTAMRLQLGALEHLFPRAMDTSSSASGRIFDGMRRGHRLIDQMVKLVQDLLDVARMQAGQLALEVRDVDLSALVADVVDRHVESLRAGGCRVDVDVHPGLRGRWDPSRLEQAIGNLLGNALKYAAGRPIAVRASAVGERAVVEVADAGPGIGLADQARIFERFERGSGAGTQPGLGLGLYIVRRIAEAHGGTASVRSEPGHGAAFRIELPCLGS